MLCRLATVFRAPLGALLGRASSPLSADSIRTQASLTSGIQGRSSTSPRNYLRHLRSLGSPRIQSGGPRLACLASTSARAVTAASNVDTSPSSCWFCGDEMDKKRQFVCDNCNYLQTPHKDATIFQLFNMCAFATAHGMYCCVHVGCVGASQHANSVRKA
jgi:hypothetical protein